MNVPRANVDAFFAILTLIWLVWEKSQGSDKIRSCKLFVSKQFSPAIITQHDLKHCRLVKRTWLESNLTVHTYKIVKYKKQPRGFCIRRSVTLLKKRIWHRCFPVNFAKFSRTAFYRTSLGDYFSNITSWKDSPKDSIHKPLIFSKTFRPVISLKKKLWHRCFPVNFAKFRRTPFLTEHLLYRWLLPKDDIFQTRITTTWSPYYSYPCYN